MVGSATVSKDTIIDIVPLDLVVVQLPGQDVLRDDGTIASSTTLQPSLTVNDPIVNASTDGIQGDNTSGHIITEQYSNARVHHDLELWEHIKDYDRRAAKEANFTRVMTRKQKQILEKQLLEGKQPCHTRSREYRQHLRNEFFLFERPRYW